MKSLSLRSRVFLASTCLVLLSLGLSGWFLTHAVRDNFSRYARAEAADQAWDLALYLEAWLNRTQHQQNPGPALQSFFAGDFPDYAPYSADDDFGPTWAAWQEIAADLLGLQPRALRQATQNQSLEELCLNLDRSPQEVLAAIMREEAQRLEDEGWEEADAVDELAGILAEAQSFVYDPPQALAKERAAEERLPERLAWFLDTLVKDAHIWALDANGRILFDSAQQDVGQVLDADLQQAAAEIYDWESGQMLCKIVVAAGPGNYRAEANTFLSSVQKSLFQSAALVLVFALLLAYWFGKRLLAPIQDLTSASSRLAAGESQNPLPVRSNDEVGRMSQSFNHLLKSLRTQKDLRKRMIADLGHELHTPLSVIQLELAGLRAGMQSAEECAQRIGVELEMLKRLAEDLQLLADADYGVLEVKMAPTDLVACCREAVRRWQPRANKNHIQIVYEGELKLPLLAADRLRVVQALGNLLSNAIRHSPEHAQIQVRAQMVQDDRGQAHCEISVQDHGEGISTDQLAHIFEPFTRVDSARNRQHAGRGLGLAIVSDLVHRQRGEVFVESRLGKGSRFSMRFPLP